MSPPSNTRPHLSRGAAAALIVLFVILQASTLDYGIRINDLAFIRDYRVAGDVLRGSGLDRPHLVGAPVDRPESLDLWMVRFKLYSIEADEVNNIIALARIRPSDWDFDPKYYQYGGAYLYALGAWYQFLSKLGLINILPLDQLLADPQQIDRVWVAGRVFVLAAVTASAILLFLMLLLVAPPHIALAGLAIYLLCPATIMFSQVMKPHWYALLWVNAALLLTVRVHMRNRMTLREEFCLAAAIGLAVGSAATFSLFAALLWGALAFLALNRRIPFAALVRIPTIALIVFVLTNPYYLLNWPAVLAEQAAVEAWFQPTFSLDTLVRFTRNSLFAGFGVVFVALALVVAVYKLASGPIGARLFAAGLLTPIAVTAAVTSNISDWHVNFRYAPYLLPAALLFVAATDWPYRGLLLALTAVATVAQAAPLKLAYFDENSDRYSTRLAAAAWIDANIPYNEAVCVPTTALAPFHVPPFRFDQHPINSPDCRWHVRVERQPDSVRIDPHETVTKRFAPRFSPQAFPFVWEHINPQITIYRKND
jgi:hypothetical protein